MPLQGFEKLTEWLDELAERAIEGAAAGLEAGLARTAELAWQLAPVKTGRLRDSIGYAVERSGGRLEGRVSASAEYAARVELGDASHPPAPFLYPAFKQCQDQIVSDVREGIAHAINEG